MIEKLTIKELAPYLPYGLKGIYPLEKNIWKLNIKLDSANYENMELPLFHFIEEGNCKPLLRPLSDLTKDIEHNGEKFVPKEKIKKLFPNVNGWYQIDDDVWGGYHKNLSHTIIEYCVMEKFIEWKFDVFGLLESGHAIDVNSLETNPYK